MKGLNDPLVCRDNSSALASIRNSSSEMGRSTPTEALLTLLNSESALHVLIKDSTLSISRMALSDA